MADAMDVDSESSLSSLSEPEDAPVDAPTPSANFRRRSTRVVKKPETFTVAHTPSTRRASKRKRTNESDAEDDGDASSENARAESNEVEGGEEEEGDGEDDEEDEEEEDEDEDEDDESSEGEPDEEELKERRRRASKASRGGGRGGRGGARGGAKPPKAPRSAPTPKKPAPKKARTDAPPKEKKEAAPKKRGRKPGPKRKVQPAANGDQPHMVNEIYDGVFENGDDLDELASAWIAKYDANRGEALKEMVNFVIKCCGCENGVTADEVLDEDDAKNCLINISEEFQEHPNADYPLMSKKPAFRKFRVNLNAFIAAFVRALHDKDYFVNDPSLLTNLEAWIGALSSSSLRQFRHTGTVVSLELCSNLCTLAAEIRKTNATTARQLEAEENKAHKNAARIQQLKDKADQGEQRRAAVEGAPKEGGLIGLIEVSFVHRFRDVDPKIRCDCIHELSNWMQTLPEVFYAPDWLRYLGWLISDPIPAVRMEVLRTLVKLFKRQDPGQMRLFMERFRARIVEIGLRDADHAVRTVGVELLDEVRKAGYLEPNDTHAIGRLLFDPSADVRKAVRPFFEETIKDMFDEKVEDLGGEEVVQEALGDEDAEDYDGPTTYWIRLKCIIEAVASYDEEPEAENGDGDSPNPFINRNRTLITKLQNVQSRYYVAFSSLYTLMEDFHDWEGMMKYLLYDHSAHTDSDDDAVMAQIKQAVALNSKEELILLELLVVSVSGKIASPMLSKPKHQVTQADMQAAKAAVSRPLAPYAPRLLKKYGPAPESAASTIKIISMLQLDVFSELRQTSALSSLLDEILRQFLTHSHDLVLRTVADCFQLALRESSSDTLDLVSEKLQKLKDTLVSNLSSAVRGKNAAAIATAKFSDKTLTEILNTVKRFEFLSAIMDTSELLNTPPPAHSATDKPLPPVDIFLALILRSSANSEIDEGLITRATKVVVFYFMWSLRDINASKDLAEDDPIFTTQLNRRKTAIAALSKILTAQSASGGMQIDPTSEVATSSATAVLDLSTLWLVARDNTPLSSATTALPVPVQDAIDNILDALERTFARASGRTAEVAIDAAPLDISSDEDDEDEDNDDPESRPSRTKKPKLPPAEQVVLEQRLCELAAKLVVAVLGGTVEQKRWRKRLARNQQNLGPNYKEVINHLDRNLAGRPGVRRGGPVAKKAGPPAAAGAAEGGGEAGGETEAGKQASRRNTKTYKSAETVDSDDDNDDDEHDEHDEEEQAQEEEAAQDEQDRESEPDPEVPLRDGDGDEEMADA